MHTPDILFLAVGLGSFLSCYGLLAVLDERVLERRR
jgi:hypothetical protein